MHKYIQDKFKSLMLCVVVFQRNILNKAQKVCNKSSSIPDLIDVMKNTKNHTARAAQCI